MRRLSSILLRTRRNRERHHIQLYVRTIMIREKNVGESRARDNADGEEVSSNIVAWEEDLEGKASTYLPEHQLHICLPQFDKRCRCR
jgi:hypothetical protein